MNLFDMRERKVNMASYAYGFMTGLMLLTGYLAVFKSAWWLIPTVAIFLLARIAFENHEVKG